MLERTALVSLSSFVLVSLAACGATGEAATSGMDAPTPPPGGDGLEAELRLLVDRADVAPMPAPPPQDPDLVELGRALFHDKVLSGNRDISCYTCHDLDTATDDALSVSIGTGGEGDSADRQLAHGRLIPRNSPPLFRLAGRPTMFWDSRVARRPDGSLDTPSDVLDGRNPAAARIASLLTSALAAQAMFPVTSREEMRGQPGENEIADGADDLETWSRLMLRLVGTDADPDSGIAGYRTLFARAYPGVARVSDLNFGHAARAIAAFEVAAFSTRGSAFDGWLAGDATALTEEEKRGGALFFGRAGCAQCHGGPALSDGRHHAIGVPQVGPGKDFPFEDTGRGLVTGDPEDRYRFRTPTLRNVAITGPWMHDGAYTSLEAAVRHYVDPARSLFEYDASQLAPLLQPLVDLDPGRQAARAAAISPIVRDGVRLDDGDVRRLLLFLDTLTDDEARDLEDVEPDGVPSGIPID